MTDLSDLTPREDAQCGKCGEILKSKSLSWNGQQYVLGYYCVNEACEYLGLLTVVFRLTTCSCEACSPRSLLRPWWVVKSLH
jgi:hypothetical protein